MTILSNYDTLNLMLIPRHYDNLDHFIKPNKVLVIFGSRQVGKTTLIRQYLTKTKFQYKLDSGDDLRVHEILGTQEFQKIIEYLSSYDLYVIDEAQRIPFIGQSLKIIVDQVPNIKVIATGSSSFELSGQIGEPLTGRKTTLILYPVSQIEIRNIFNKSELGERLPQFLVYGSYPAVLTVKAKQEKIELLEEIVHSYLLKDILEIEKVKGSKVLLDLLRLIAFQIGSEVSLTELGGQLGIDYKTVARYLDLLEKSFVLYNLRGFSSNLRKEIAKKSKYYFYDNGIRNAVISNFNSLDLRDDIGKLWENFMVSERLKTQKYKNIYANNYFWRTIDKKEVDWVEESEGKLCGYEFKYQKEDKKNIAAFKKMFPDAMIKTINKDNYLDFLRVK